VPLIKVIAARQRTDGVGAAGHAELVGEGAGCTVARTAVAPRKEQETATISMAATKEMAATRSWLREATQMLRQLNRFLCNPENPDRANPTNWGLRCGKRAMAG
jgi:hypothetical protein